MVEITEKCCTCKQICIPYAGSNANPHTGNVLYWCEWCYKLGQKEW